MLDLQHGGTISYTERAFEQDAQEAMRGDIVRGLIELITNADDAYAKQSARSGKIIVEVEHRRGTQWQVIVRDRASGMTLQEMKEKLPPLGARTSGFELGAQVRGNLGRGAKDLTAFGPTTWESIKDEKYAALRINVDGSYDITPRDTTATQSDRERLGIPRGKSGTVATVLVRSNIRCPNHGSLITRLSQHFQLRDVVNDELREVWLVNGNRPQDERNRLRGPMGDLPTVWSGDLGIPDYPEATAKLRIQRLPEACTGTATDPGRPCGVLIKGARAIYENTLFSFEGNHYANVFHGRLECPHIDYLARAYDDRSSEGLEPSRENPSPIIGRTRDSLRREHPFYVALRTAVDEVLQCLVREEEERARRENVRVENVRTRRELESLARESARFMQEELRNAQAEELPSSTGSNGVPPDISIIPAEATCFLGEDKTLTVAVRHEVDGDDAAVTASVDPKGVVELIDGSLITLRPHRSRPDLLVGQIRLRPLVPDVALIQCEIGNRIAEAMVTVQEERSEPLPEPLPIQLEFERPLYRIGWTKTRLIKLRAPLDLVETGTVFTVTSNAPGIVVLNGRIELLPDPSSRYLEGQIRVEGRAIGAEGTVRASGGDLVALCRAMVTRDEDGPSLRFEIRDSEAGPYRALWDDEEDPRTGESVRTLIIQARHPALNRYLGPAPNFPGQNAPWAKLLVAEIVADNVCREISRRIDVLRHRDDRPDSEGFYNEHYERMLRILPKLHLLLLPAVPIELS